MISSIHKKQSSLLYKVLCGFIAVAFLAGVILPPQAAWAQAGTALLNLPVPGTMVPPSRGFIPALMTGVTVHPDDPLRFDFIIDTGHTDLKGEPLKAESRKLIKYFLAALTVPEDELWVNLSPYEQDRMVAPGLGKTEMGRDMLAQDYLLKQLTASLMYPEEELGKKFWDRVYKKVQEQFGTTDIPVNTFNKVWIVPEEAVVYEQGTSAFVVKSRLAVMLEEDYVAMNSIVGNADLRSVQGQAAVSAEIIREIIIPEIEKEVNEGETFANLRQIYNSLILATWYKQRLKESLLGKVYVNQNKTKGINPDDPAVNQKIYDRYIASFEKGVYNYIKEDVDPVTQQVVPRKYFSGGVNTYNPRPGKGWLSRMIAATILTGFLLSGSPASVQAEVSGALAGVGTKLGVTTQLVENASGDAENTSAIVVHNGPAPAPLLLAGNEAVYPEPSGAATEGGLAQDRMASSPVEMNPKTAKRIYDKLVQYIAGTKSKKTPVDLVNQQLRHLEAHPGQKRQGISTRVWQILLDEGVEPWARDQIWSLLVSLEEISDKKGVKPERSLTKNRDYVDLLPYIYPISVAPAVSEREARDRRQRYEVAATEGTNRELSKLGFGVVQAFLKSFDFSTNMHNFAARHYFGTLYKLSIDFPSWLNVHPGMVSKKGRDVFFDIREDVLFPLEDSLDNMSDPFTEFNVRRLRTAMMILASGIARSVYDKTAQEQGIILMVEVTAHNDLKERRLIAPHGFGGNQDTIKLAIQNGEVVYKHPTKKAYYPLYVIKIDETYLDNDEGQPLAEGRLSIPYMDESSGPDTARSLEQGLANSTETPPASSQASSDETSSSPVAVEVEEDAQWDKSDNVFTVINEKLIKQREDIYFEESSSYFRHKGGLYDIFHAPARSGFLAKHLPIKEGDEVLDFGTGSGILSFYAAAKGAKRILAIDKQYHSVEFTKMHVEQFGYEDVIDVKESDGYENVESERKFNLITFFAPPFTVDARQTDSQRYDVNGEIITKFFSGMRRHLAPNGQAGLMYPDNPASILRIEELSSINGLRIIKRITMGSMNERHDDSLADRGFMTWSLFMMKGIESPTTSSPVEGGRQELLAGEWKHDPSAREVMTIARIGKPAPATVAVLPPDMTSVTNAAVLALESSGLKGQGNKVAIDTVATQAMRDELRRIAKKYNARYLHVTGEGLKDGVPPEAMFGNGENIGSQEVPVSLEIGSDPVDGTGNLSKFKEGEGKEGRTNSTVVAGQKIIPAPDNVRAWALSYNDRGREVDFDLSDVARNQQEEGQGKISLEDAFVKFVREYSQKVNIPLNEITVHIMSGHEVGENASLREPDRHLNVFRKLKQIGVNVIGFNHVTISAEAFAGVVPGHIYFGVSGATETFFTAQGLKNLSAKGAKVYVQIATDSVGYNVEPESSVSGFYKTISKDRNDMANRFAFSRENVEALRKAVNYKTGGRYWSEAEIQEILQGNKVWTMDNLPPADLYVTFYLPTGYVYRSLEGGEVVHVDKGIEKEDDDSRTLYTLVMNAEGVFIVKDKFRNALSDLNFERVEPGSSRIRARQSYVPPELNYSLYIIPHGQTQANEEGIILSHKEDPRFTYLAKEGQDQSAAGAEAFWAKFGEQITQSPEDFVFLTSPAMRTRQTADHYERVSGGRIKFEEDKGAVEIDFGDYHGKKRDDLLLQDQKLLDESRTGNAFVRFGEGQNQVEFLKQVHDWLVGNNAKYRGKKVFLVGHGTFTKAVATILQTEPDRSGFINLSQAISNMKRGHVHPMYTADTSSSPVEKDREQGTGDRVQKEVPRDTSDGIRTTKKVGGIDLNPAFLDLQIRRDGNGVALPLPMQPIETMRIDGFVPIIINITPIPNLPMLLGLADTGPDTRETRPASKAREVESASLLN